MPDLHRFGNRWHQNGPLSFSATFTGNTPSSPANNNRVDGLTYDAAGNLLNDGVHNYFYDAENRLIQVDGTLGDCSSTSTLAHATACYYYDARGSGLYLQTPNKKTAAASCAPASPTTTTAAVTPPASAATSEFTLSAAQRICRRRTEGGE